MVVDDEQFNTFLTLYASKFVYGHSRFPQPLESVIKSVILFYITIIVKEMSMVHNTRTHLKNASRGPVLRCGPAQNVLLIPPLAGLRFFAIPRLALNPDPLFLR
jgi:hypothetical protein